MHAAARESPVLSMNGLTNGTSVAEAETVRLDRPAVAVTFTAATLAATWPVNVADSWPALTVTELGNVEK